MNKEKLRRLLVELVEKQVCDLDVDYWVENAVYALYDEDSLMVVTKNKMRLTALKHESGYTAIIGSLCGG